MQRRKFVKILGATTLAAFSDRFPSWCDSPEGDRFLVPVDKGFSEAWLKALTARGEPLIYRNEELKYIGMPVGGLCAGMLYLGGDGKLWLWDIFNRTTMTKNVTYQGRSFGNPDGSTYVEPWTQMSPLAQGFAIKYQMGSLSGNRTLDQYGGWPDLTFEGKYPVGIVNYRDPALPLSVKLEAFSPFIPLSFDDSSLPATVLHYTVTNTGRETAQITLGGWLENVVLAMSSPDDPVQRQNQPLTDANGRGLLLTGQMSEPKGDVQPDVLFEDFSSGTYDGWTTGGDAFGDRPVARKDLPTYMSDIGGVGDYIVTSHNFRLGRGLDAADNATGTLTSKTFTIDHNYISFFSSGGNRPHEAGVRLLIDGQSMLEKTGDNNNQLVERYWGVSKYRGKTAQIQLFDNATGGWGNVHASKFVFTDKLPSGKAPGKRSDAGTMALMVLGDGKGVTTLESLPDGKPEEQVFSDAEAVVPPGRPLGAVRKKLNLAPGESATVTFVLAWNFPNIDPAVNGPPDSMTHYYASRFSDAGAVAQYVSANYLRLADDTMNWVQTWHESSLPYWFLFRTFCNTCNLATTTSYRFSNGEFWAWEGIYSCEGTCTHVWGYTQAMGRLFPELERALREKTDYDYALSNDGTIQYRGRGGYGFASDGQAMIILRTYRDHLMTLDDSFLTPLWPRVKRATDRLLVQANDKGLLDGSQHNTLDTEWYGEVAWLSGLFLAALRASEEMAKVMGDSDYAQKCRAIFDKGSAALVPELFNGEYFINKVDPNHLDAINSGTGCECDQVMGQSWAWQTGLGRIFPEKETTTALKSLFRYNFAPDAGLYHESMKVGRWYAMPGEAGLLLCTFPQPEWDFKKSSGKGPSWAALYFNDCMTGFEHEAASHMIAEGLLTEGLAVTRAIQDRYAPFKRNPYNEIECGDHYSRAMASYATFITMSGYEYRGPDGYIAFAPRLTPENFKAAFTSAAGWGSFEQQTSPSHQQAKITVNWGELSVSTVGLQLVGNFHPTGVRASLDGQVLTTSLSPQPDRMNVVFTSPVSIKKGVALTILLS